MTVMAEITGFEVWWTKSESWLGYLLAWASLSLFGFPFPFYVGAIIVFAL